MASIMLSRDPSGSNSAGVLHHHPVAPGLGTPGLWYNKTPLFFPNNPTGLLYRSCSPNLLSSSSNTALGSWGSNTLLDGELKGESPVRIENPGRLFGVTGGGGKY